MLFNFDLFCVYLLFSFARFGSDRFGQSKHINGNPVGKSYARRSREDDNFVYTYQDQAHSPLQIASESSGISSNRYSITFVINLLSSYIWFNFSLRKISIPSKVRSRLPFFPSRKTPAYLKFSIANFRNIFCFSQVSEKCVPNRWGISTFGCVV